MEGWISLHRQFLSWEWFDDNNMVKLFIYLLLKANHKKGTHQGLTIKRGQLKTGLDKLNNETKITIQTLRTCLKRLEKTGEINMQVTNKYRVITVCNYELYQDNQQATNKQTNKQLTSNQQATNKQLTANNNVNKNNNNNNVNNYKNKLLSELSASDFENPDYFEITISFWELFKKNLTEAGASISNLEKAKGKWVDEIRLMIESDKQNIDSVRTVFVYLQNDDFWKKNILSTKKLREKFNTLLLNAKHKSNGNSKTQPATSYQELKDILSKHFD